MFKLTRFNRLFTQMKAIGFKITILGKIPDQRKWRPRYGRPAEKAANLIPTLKSLDLSKAAVLE